MTTLIIRKKGKGSELTITVEKMVVSIIEIRDEIEKGLQIIDTIGLSKASIRKISKKWREANVPV